MAPPSIPSASPDPEPGSRRGPRPDAEVERSAGGVVVRLLDQVPHVLLIRDPYRKWGLPKGHLENGEGAAEAALREVREETGLQSLVLGPDLGEIDWAFTTGGRRIHKYCRFFLMASAEGETRPELDEGITECRWLPGEDAVAAVAYDNARGVIRRALGRLGGPGTGPVPWSAGDTR